MMEDIVRPLWSLFENYISWLEPNNCWVGCCVYVSLLNIEEKRKFRNRSVVDVDEVLFWFQKYEIYMQDMFGCKS